jgi:hypothetical protein
MSFSLITFTYEWQVKLFRLLDCAENVSIPTRHLLVISQRCEEAHISTSVSALH